MAQWVGGWWRCEDEWRVVFRVGGGSVVGVLVGGVGGGWGGRWWVASEMVGAVGGGEWAGWRSRVGCVWVDAIVVSVVG